MGRCQYQGRSDEEAGAFGTFLDIIAFWIFFFGFDPSDSVEGEGEQLLITDLSSAILFTEDKLIAGK
jgi:hypothetical protein